jgi:hypothetical protein
MQTTCHNSNSTIKINPTDITQAPSSAKTTSDHRIPLWLKMAYTAFMAVLVPAYWSFYGPTNFLYFCDVALFVTLAALWTESALLAGMAAVGIIVPQFVWVADFACGMFGVKLLGMTEYMFNSSSPLFTRGLSLFHGWLPFLLLYLVAKLGYDRRALRSWTILAYALVVVCYFWMPAPPAPMSNPALPVNINYVYGLSDSEPQHWMAPEAWVLLLAVVLFTAFFVPAHFILKKFFPMPVTASVCGMESKVIPLPKNQ